MTTCRATGSVTIHTTLKVNAEYTVVNNVLALKAAGSRTRFWRSCDIITHRATPLLMTNRYRSSMHGRGLLGNCIGEEWEELLCSALVEPAAQHAVLLFCGPDIDVLNDCEPCTSHMYTYACKSIYTCVALLSGRFRHLVNCNY